LTEYCGAHVVPRHVPVAGTSAMRGTVEGAAKSA
jgi:hypothetical protein